MNVDEVVLATGLRVQVVRRPSVPVVRARLQLPRCSRTPLDTAATELLAAEVAAARTPCARRVRRAGGQVVAWATAERFSVDAHAPTHALPDLLAWVAEATRPGVAPSGLGQVRDELACRLTRAPRDPSVAAADALNRLRFGDHPALRPPDAGALARVGPGDVEAAARGLLRPDGAVLVVVGDLDPAEAVDRVRAAFGDWRAAGPAQQLTLPPARECRQGLHLAGEESALLRLVTGAPGRDDPAEGAFQLATLVLGGFFSSRLVRRLRHQSGMAYSVHAGPDALAATRSVTLDVRVRAADMPATMRIVHAELSRFAADGPSPEELAAARRYALGQFTAAGATQAALVEGLAVLATQQLDTGWPDRHAERLETATAEQVAAAAHRIGTAIWSHALVGGRQGSHVEGAA